MIYNDIVYNLNTLGLFFLPHFDTSVQARIIEFIVLQRKEKTFYYSHSYIILYDYP